MKWLDMTSSAATPKPSATNPLPAPGRGQTRRRHRPAAWYRACPVPCAITLTFIPVLALKIGKMHPKRPQSCVDVVGAPMLERPVPSPQMRQRVRPHDGEHEKQV